jgi:hypothetical protein
MRGAVLVGHFPGLDSDPLAIHGWLSREGDIRRLGPWVPPFAKPWQSSLICSDEGRALLDRWAVRGVVGYQKCELQVADVRICNRFSLEGQRGMDWRRTNNRWKASKVATVHAWQVMAVRIESSLREELRDGLCVSVTRPMAIDGIDVGVLACNGDDGFGEDLIPRWWVSERLKALFEDHFRGWFRFNEAMLG